MTYVAVCESDLVDLGGKDEVESDVSSQQIKGRHVSSEMTRCQVDNAESEGPRLPDLVKLLSIEQVKYDLMVHVYSQW